MPTIHQRIEPRRGCGYRKPGGKYLVTANTFTTCCKLPWPLSVCPTCGAGIKQARGFTWINTDIFNQPGNKCIIEISACIMNRPGEKIGLLWIGEKYYKDPADFTSEAVTMGISKRIAQIPREFEVGKTRIALAHPKVNMSDHSVISSNRITVPAIFMVIRPTAIEYVVTGKETDIQLAQLEKRGFTLVNVIHDTEAQTKLFINEKIVL